jgi:hypothetical protein
MCSENGFGILSNRFLIYRSAMRYDPGKATKIVMATIALHNWLRSSAVGTAMYTPTGSLDDENTVTGTYKILHVFDDYEQNNFWS